MTSRYDVVSHDGAEETIIPIDLLQEEDSTTMDTDQEQQQQLNARLINFSSEHGMRYRSKDDGGRRKSIEEIDPLEAEKWLNPYAIGNIGIFASYLGVGFGMYFIQTPLQYYMVDTLDATAAQQSVVMGLLHLPWALKIVCGFLSDSLPMFGLRRKPYFLIGWVLWTVCNIILAIIGKPDIGTLAFFIFFMTWCFILADVATDAMIVERSKAYEHVKNRGSLQATGYILRFFAAIIGALCGAILYNKESWGWGLPMWGIFLMNGFVPLIVVAPFFYNIVEVRIEEPPQLRDQLQSIWELVQRKAVWGPCSFVYVFNVFLVTNPAWNAFLINGLGFSNFNIGLLVLAGTVLSYIALNIYRTCLFDTSWHLIYLFATSMMTLFACMQLILVFGVNKQIGMGSLECAMIFAVFSYGGVQFVQSIQFLPTCRMFLGMCPVGAEGASYAMLTTISNVAHTVAYSIAGAMAGVWDVSNDKLKDHDYSGMWKLTLFCGCVQMTGLCLLWRLPKGINEQMKRQESTEGDSKLMGGVFVGVLGASLCFVVAFSVKTIITG